MTTRRGNLRAFRSAATSGGADQPDDTGAIGGGELEPLERPGVLMYWPRSRVSCAVGASFINRDL